MSKAKRDVTRFCDAQGWKCELVKMGRVYYVAVHDKPRIYGTFDTPKAAWKAARLYCRSAYPDLWAAFEQSEARDATAPVDPAPSEQAARERMEAALPEGWKAWVSIIIYSADDTGEYSGPGYRDPAAAYTAAAEWFEARGAE